MSQGNLTDQEGKNTLRHWPTRIKRLWGTPSTHGFWIRAQPKLPAEKHPSPTIRVPGARLFTTQPDAMWVFLAGDEYADAMVVEICGSAQNLNDKRSRYAATVRSLVLTCPTRWLHYPIRVQRGGEAPRWQACRSIPKGPTSDLALPVRYLRVLFALPNSLYPTWSANNVADGHEFFCRHSSLATYTGQQAQSFLRSMSPYVHFMTRP
jgi:hypothetical protein